LQGAGAQTVANWATAISAGPADESAQTVNFIVTNTNSALFAAQPAISATGTLTYTPASGATGAATVTVQLHDTGGVANGGVDTSAAQTFTITVNAVNHAPVATPQAVSTNEDVAKAITLSATDIDNDTLSYSVVTPPTHGTLSGTAPNLTYTPAANYNGGASFTFKANDGTVDSAPATVSITVTAVNDAPSFTKGADQTVLEDAGAQTVANWATAISAGPADESAQTLTFQVTANTNAALFAARSAERRAGTDTNAPGSGANGLARMRGRRDDTGGIAKEDGGSDT